jgi:hypothetical protein
VLDANVLMRFHNCGALEVLGGTVRLVVSPHVYKECTRVGPEIRQRLRDLDLERAALTPGTSEWDQLAIVRGGLCSPRNLGEDESIALCLARAARGQRLPFVTYDRRALTSLTASDTPTAAGPPSPPPTPCSASHPARTPASWPRRGHEHARGARRFAFRESPIESNAWAMVC